MTPITHIPIPDKEHRDDPIGSRTIIDAFEKLNVLIDERNVKLPPPKFLPEGDDDFWYVNEFGELIAAGNCFPDEASAEVFAEKMKELLNQP